MESRNDAEAIKPIRDVVREHIEATMARCFPKVPQYRIAMELGVSPTTLIRMRKRWAEKEAR